MIVIADHFSRLRPFVQNIPVVTRNEIMASWPGPNTWLLPARKSVSTWLKGESNSIAVRVTRHRPARMLCRTAGIAIVSTSANISGRPAYRDPAALFFGMGSQIDGIMEGRIGARRSPSVIRDGEDGRHVRQ